MKIREIIQNSWVNPGFGVAPHFDFDQAEKEIIELMEEKDKKIFVLEKEIECLKKYIGEAKSGIEELKNG